MSNVDFRFDACNFVITGASSGMGRLLAKELAAAGAHVLAIARREDRLLALKEKHSAYIVPYAVDVSDTSAMESGIADFVSQYGKLSGAVYAAGISGLTPLRAFDGGLAKQIMQVSFWSGMDFIQMVSKKKYSMDGASMVLFSSVMATACEKGIFAYSASKAAVNAGIKTAAKELAKRRQRVNSVMPGWVWTEMTEIRKVDSDVDSLVSRALLGAGCAEDVTGMVLFLLSDRARWITGTAIAVDGGYLA